MGNLLASIFALVQFFETPQIFKCDPVTGEARDKLEGIFRDDELILIGVTKL